MTRIQTVFNLLKRVGFAFLFCCNTVISSGEVLDPIWYYTYGGTGNDSFWDIAPDLTGGYLASGYYIPPHSSIAGVIVRLAANGDTIWTKSLREEHVTEVRGITAIDTAYFMFTGTLYELGRGDVAVVGKGRMDGGSLEIYTYDSLNCDFTFSIDFSDEGYAVVAGGHPFSALRQDATVFKVDMEGELIWSRDFGSIYSEHFEDACMLPDGSIVAAGYTRHNSSTESRFYVARMTSDGDSIWTQHLGLGPRSWAHSLTPIGYDVIIAGDEETEDDGRQICLMRVDSSGNVVWQRLYGGSSADYAYHVSPVAGTNYFLASGITRISDGDRRGMFEICIDENGDTLWTATVDLGNSVSTWASAGIAIDLSTFLVAGKMTTDQSSTSDAVVTMVSLRSNAGIEQNTPSIAPSPIVVTPNPASERIEFIVPPNMSGDITVRVFDILGRQVLSENQSIEYLQFMSLSQNVQSLATGSYYIVVNSSGKVNIGSFRVVR